MASGSFPLHVSSVSPFGHFPLPSSVSPLVESAAGRSLRDATRRRETVDGGWGADSRLARSFLVTEPRLIRSWRVRRDRETRHSPPTARSPSLLHLRSFRSGSRSRRRRGRRPVNGRNEGYGRRRVASRCSLLPFSFPSSHPFGRSRFVSSPHPPYGRDEERGRMTSDEGTWGEVRTDRRGSLASRLSLISFLSSRACRLASLATPSAT